MRYFLKISAFAFFIGFVAFSPGTSESATNISNSPNWNSMAPRVAVDSAGNVHVVWAENYAADTGDLFYSRYTLSRQEWSPPLNLSNSNRVFCDSHMCCGIDIDGQGRIYAVWVEDNEVKLRINDGSNWGGITVVSSGGFDCDHPRVAVTSNGDIYIIWWTSDGIVYSRARVGGNWEGVQTLSDTGRRSKFSDISVGNNVVAASWVEKGGEVYQAAYTQRGRGYGAGWTGRQRVSPSSFSQQHAVLELDSQDVAHIIWTDVLNDATGLRVVKYSYGGGGGFSSPIEISSSQVLHYPSIADRNNDMFACWQLGSYGAGQGIDYNIRRGSTWTGEAYVPDSGGATFSDIAVSMDANAIYIVWDGNGEIWIHGTTGSGTTPNKPPVANFLFSPTTGDFPLDVTFDASLSYDPDGSIARYDWDFGDGKFGTGKIVKHTYTYSGKFSVRLTVTDNKGTTGSIIKILEVLKPNVPPMADFNFSPTTGIFPLDVTFDGSASSDSDGYITRYDWDFGDGSGASGQIVTHKFSKWGTFSVRVTVTDNRSAAAYKVKIIEVLRLLLPLNIRWETHLDEGLFLSRYITDVYWEKNPENDRIAKIAHSEITRYRVYRKKPQEDNKAYKIVAETDPNTFHYRDPSVGGMNLYTYMVTAIDSMGHESPIESAPPASALLFKNKAPAKRGLSRNK